MKTIYDYFTYEVEHPTVTKGEILPFNTMYLEVDTNFLDAFINNCEKHMIVYSLDYYKTKDEKKDIIMDINMNGYQNVHTKFSDIQDDIIIVSKIENGYMFFWYHLSGRCDIGRFTTNDTYEQIEDSIINWMKGLIRDNSISGYSKLVADKYLKGWVSF